MKISCPGLNIIGDIEPQRQGPGKVGPPLSGGPAELYLPTKAVPAGGVVVLHGCDGVGPHYREWARRLAEPDCASPQNLPFDAFTYDFNAC